MNNKWSKAAEAKISPSSAAPCTTLISLGSNALPTSCARSSDVGEFGRFDDGAISSSQDSDKRAESGHDRKIPGRDDSNDAKRRVFHSRLGIRRHGRMRLGLQPALEVLRSEAERTKRAQQLDSGLVVASMTVIVGHCLRDALLVLDQQCRRTLQPSKPNVLRRKTVAEISITLQLDQRVELGFEGTWVGHLFYSGWLAHRLDELQGQRPPANRKAKGGVELRRSI